MTYFITNLALNNYAGEKIFNIGEHLAKLVDRVLSPIWLTLLSSKMQNSQDELMTETVINCGYVNRQINASLLSTNIKLL